jgi:hypothetical protein
MWVVNGQRVITRVFSGDIIGLQGRSFREVVFMRSRVLALLRGERNHAALGWIGAGLVLAVAGLWSLEAACDTLEKQTARLERDCYQFSQALETA